MKNLIGINESQLGTDFVTGFSIKIVSGITFPSKKNGAKLAGKHIDTLDGIHEKIHDNSIVKCLVFLYANLFLYKFYQAFLKISQIGFTFCLVRILSFSLVFTKEIGPTTTFTPFSANTDFFYKSKMRKSANNVMWSNVVTKRASKSSTTPRS